MHPTLFAIGGVAVPAYAALVTVAYAFGVLCGLWLGRREGRPWEDLLEMGVVIVLSAVLGSKLFHVLFEAAGHHLSDGRIATGLMDLLRDDPWHWARLFESGYVFYGGVVGAVFAAWAYTVRRALPDKGAFGDYAAPGIAFGIFIGRIGCFLAGCCYGAPTTAAWAVHFPASHATHGAAVHPVQLIDASFGLVACIAMVLLWSKRRFSGEALCALGTSYAVFRFCTELLRADADRGVWLGNRLSTSQVVALVSVPLIAFFWRRGLRLARAGRLPRPGRAWEESAA